MGPFLLATGVMLWGWGLDDPGGFFRHPARAGVLLAALLGLVFVLVSGMDLQVFRRGQRPVGRQRWALAAVMATGASCVWFLPYADRRGLLTFADAGALRYLGLVLYLAGNTLGAAALSALGKQYSGYATLQEDHQLVQTGIYGLIRHPIYLRAVLVFLGLPLVFRSWLVIPLPILGAAFVLLRIRQEEKLLREHFGLEFDRYCQRTWRLVPYLY